MAVTQAGRAVSVRTPLGEDVLLFHRMSAREQIGRLFEYELDLLSENHQIELDDILGQNVTVELELPDGGTRHFNGFVCRFSHAGTVARFAAYRATVRPWLWFLTRTSDCRIFQDKTVPEIVKEVFRDSGFTDIQDNLSGSYRKWDYCVQYRETDFAFVSRLMEHEGIYYYFKHQKDKHLLVLADSENGHEAVPGYDQVPYFPPDEHRRRERDHIFDWSVAREVHSGAFVTTDYDFERPKADLKAQKSKPRSHPNGDLELFEYPGKYTETADGTTYSSVRLEEVGAQVERVHGVGNARGLSVGSLFELTSYPRGDQNREYLIVEADYVVVSDEYRSTESGSEEETFSCRIAAIDSRTPFRPPRVMPKPVVQGPQTAMVVGKAGEEIWTDKYGRVKVKFHWDRTAARDETSSCWIRVAQLWAGKSWGGMLIPRVGQEVIVDFLEGDPDRPIITGRVYNGDAMPPYGLPGNATRTTLKSNSSKGGGGFNEIRLEDAKDKEELFLHAQKDMNTVVLNDQTAEIGRDRKVTVKRDETVAVQRDQKQSVTGNQDEDVGGNRTISITGNDETKVSGTRDVAVTGKLTISSTQEIELKCGAASILMKNDGTVTVKGVRVTVDGAQTAVKASGKLEATSSGLATVKGSMLQLDGSGIAMLKGGLVKIN